MDLSFPAESISAEPNSYRTLTVSVADVDPSDILDHFKVEDIISHFGIGDILEAIGIDEAKEHFNLVEPEF